MKKLLLLTTIASAIALTACQSELDEPQATEKVQETITNTNIQGAKSLIYLDSEMSRSRGRGGTLCTKTATIGLSVYSTTRV